MRVGATLVVAAFALGAAACGASKDANASEGNEGKQAQNAPAAGGDTAVSANVTGGGDLSMKPQGPIATLPPNEMGMIPVLEYHVIQDHVFDEF